MTLYYSYLFSDLNPAEFVMSGLKQIIEKQNSENKVLLDKIFSLERKNKSLADKNTELLQQMEK